MGTNAHVRRWLLAAAAASTALTFAACGSSDDSSGTTAASGATSTASAGADTGGGSKVVEEKTIGWVDATLAGSFQQREYQAGKEAIEHVGWKLKTVDTKGDPATAASGVSSLVTSGVDAIVLSAVTPATARAGLLQAKQKGIPVVMVGSSVDRSLDESLDLTYLGADEAALTEPLARLMLEQLRPGDEVGMLSTTALASAVERTETLTKALEAGGIRVIRPLETGFDFSAGVKNASTLLNQNPRLAAIVPIFDLWTAATVSAIKSAKRDDVKVYSFYADAVNTPLMRKNPEMIVGLTDGDLVKSPLIAVDQLLKHFADDAEIDPAAADGRFEYGSITERNLPPGDQNGPVAPAEAAAPYYEQWDAEYQYGG